MDQDLLDSVIVEVFINHFFPSDVATGNGDWLSCPIGLRRILIHCHVGSWGDNENLVALSQGVSATGYEFPTGWLGVEVHWKRFLSSTPCGVSSVLKLKGGSGIQDRIGFMVIDLEGNAVQTKCVPCIIVAKHAGTIKVIVRAVLERFGSHFLDTAIRLDAVNALHETGYFIVRVVHLNSVNVDGHEDNIRGSAFSLDGDVAPIAFIPRRN